ncbi:hypothetical protein LINPERPRIM_LOCUS24048, partial [Linum perenne]
NRLTRIAPIQKISNERSRRSSKLIEQLPPFLQLARHHLHPIAESHFPSLTRLQLGRRSFPSHRKPNIPPIDQPRSQQLPRPDAFSGISPAFSSSISPGTCFVERFRST